MTNEMASIPADAELAREAHELVQQANQFVMRACARAGQLAPLNQAVSEGAEFHLEIKMPPNATLVASAKTAAGAVTFFEIVLPDPPPKFDA